MQRNDLVCQTVQYLECSFLVLFATAKLYANKPHPRIDVEKALDKYQRTGRFDNDVSDFCLDIMARRTSLDIVLKKHGVQCAKKKSTQRP